MTWHTIDSLESIEKIDSSSVYKPQIIFKHSTRCSISSAALQKFESTQLDIAEYDCHFLDLIKYREVSNFIAEKYKVHHESPQVLLIKNGECVYDESHLAIDWDDIIATTSSN